MGDFNKSNIIRGFIIVKTLRQIRTKLKLSMSVNKMICFNVCDRSIFNEIVIFFVFVFLLHFQSTVLYVSTLHIMCIDRKSFVSIIGNFQDSFVQNLKLFDEISCIFCFID